MANACSWPLLNQGCSANAAWPHDGISVHLQMGFNGVCSPHHVLSPSLPWVSETSIAAMDEHKFLGQASEEEPQEGLKWELLSTTTISPGPDIS